MLKSYNENVEISGDQQYGYVINWLCRHLWLFTIIMFFISFAIRLSLSFWTGPVVTQLAFPDEIRFLHIARSLAENGQILVRGIQSTYQKILYPLIISPAFLLSDNQLTQVNIIRVINCLLISSTVFPVHLLANKLTKNKIIVLIVLIITITLPDFKYSAGIFSEVLFLPLVIWIFYIAYCAIAEQRRHKKMMIYGLFGFVTYMAYLTKEIAAAFLIVMSLLLMY